MKPASGYASKQFILSTGPPAEMTRDFAVLPVEILLLRAYLLLALLYPIIRRRQLV